jgi:photosystem II stability/assembly factor-like uncharacterized protein
MVAFLSGCSLLNKGFTESLGGIIKSSDGGNIWEVKNKINDKLNISAVDIVAIEIDPANSNKIYLGTKNKGLLVSEDGAESWSETNFPASKNVYGVAIDHSNSQVVYASGSLKDRGKIFKTEDGGENWEEIYTEPSNGTYITSLSMSDFDSQNIFAGTSLGVIFKTNNGGASWDNIYFEEEDPIANIIFSNDSRNTIYFLFYGSSVRISSDGGQTLSSIEGLSDKINGGKPYSIDVQKFTDGVFYIGTDKGLFKATNYGANVDELDIIASSKKFPVRSISINPSNPSEIIYSVAQAIYKTSDGRENWSTTQLDTTKNISIIRFNKENPRIIYAGFRDF